MFRHLLYMGHGGFFKSLAAFVKMAGTMMVMLMESEISPIIEKSETIGQCKKKSKKTTRACL